MKVVVVTSFPFPDGKATANRVRVFAEELIKNGYADEVEIVSTTSVLRGSPTFKEKIKIVSLCVPVIDKNKLISRAISELLVAFKLWSIAKKTKADMVIVTIPSALLLIPIVIFPKPIRLVLDVRDAVWAYLPKYTLKGLLGTVLRILFRVAAKKSDLVSVTNSYEAKSVKAVARVDAIVVGNGISEEKINDFQSIAVKPARGNINITYIGNVGIAQELEILIKYAKYYQNNTVVNVVGDGARLAALKAKAIDENVSNMKFHGAIPPDNVARYMKEADVLFAQIGKNYISAIPTKVFEYIAAGRKILLGLPEGAAKDVFQDFHGVEIFPVGIFTCMKQSYEKLLIQEFGDEERIRNLTLLKCRYVRERAVTNLLLELNSM
jgi:glycosyltransferase involved in cell wall biosynthesis